MTRLWMLAIACGCHAKEPIEPEFDTSVSFLTPPEGGSVPAGVVDISLIVEDFALTAPESTARWAPSSPLAWLVPVAEAHNEEGLPSGYCALSLDGVPLANLSDTQYSQSGVTVGVHTLSCELLFADGDPLDPPVSAEILFTASEP